MAKSMQSRWRAGTAGGQGDDDRGKRNKKQTEKVTDRGDTHAREGEKSRESDTETEKNRDSDTQAPRGKKHQLPH